MPPRTEPWCSTRTISDETLPGPFEWDVKRLVASFAVAGRDRGFDKARRQAVNLSVGRSYREAMADFASIRTFDPWYSRVDVTDAFARLVSEVSAKAVKRAERNVAKARTKDSLAAFKKLTPVVDGEPRIVSDPPLIVPIAELFSGEQTLEAERQVIRQYRRTLLGDRRHLLERLRLVDAARKVVGVGSVGTRTYMALLIGKGDYDPLFLQFKEAERSVLEPYAGASVYENHGERVVVGQRLTQAATDIFLGWIPGSKGEPTDYYFRQLRDMKGSVEVDAILPAGFRLYGQLCGAVLARAHARTGDAVAIAGYLGTGDVFDRAIVDFAEAYADQTERDHGLLVEAVRSGRLEALEGV